ncbi:MAG: hypothetical protein IJY00_06330, partial [Bacteroidaceae bacterium]|nr:hypothetical protein [Bacteroidaceae bacterium]
LLKRRLSYAKTLQAECNETFFELLKRRLSYAKIINRGRFLRVCPLIFCCFPICGCGFGMFGAGCRV